jgi:hypothetical protein
MLTSRGAFSRLPAGEEFAAFPESQQNDGWQERPAGLWI